MKDLDDIFSSIAKREILFEEGDWCIYRKDSDTVTDRLNVVHRCDQSAMSMNNSTAKWVCGNGSHNGGGCGEPAPEKLKGLFMLYTWER